MSEQKIQPATDEQIARWAPEIDPRILARIDADREKIAALEADRDSWATQADQRAGELLAALKRVEALEAEVALKDNDNAVIERVWSASNARLEAENAKIRKALERLRDCGPYPQSSREIAREALK